MAVGAEGEEGGGCARRSKGKNILAEQKEDRRGALRKQKREHPGSKGRGALAVEGEGLEERGPKDAACI